MNETTTSALRTHEHEAARSRPGAPRPPAADGAEQLPFEPLPYDDEADHPIPFSLTARARLEVAPEQLPTLAVVRDGAHAADAGGLDEPGDTRPARARALRRAGLTASAIAAQLGADELAVRAWIGDVVVHRRGRRSTRDGVAAPSRGDATPAGTAGGQAASTGAGDDDHEVAFQLARADARGAAAARLSNDAPFAAGLGLATGIVEIDAHAITVTTGDPLVACHLLRWLAANVAFDPQRVRVVLRLGSAVSGDLARHRWARELGLPLERVAHTRFRPAPTPDAVEVLIRVADPVVAATVAGWRDALLTPDQGAGPADVAF